MGFIQGHLEYTCSMNEFSPNNWLSTYPPLKELTPEWVAERQKELREGFYQAAVIGNTTCPLQARMLKVIGFKHIATWRGNHSKDVMTFIITRNDLKHLKPLKRTIKLTTTLKQKVKKLLTKESEAF